MPQFFMTVAPGLESVALAELAQFGLRATEEGPGSLSVRAKLRTMLRVHLHTRCLHRVSMEVGQFRARSFDELVRKARALPWGTWLHKHQTFTVRASAAQSRLYHSDAIAQRVAEAITAATSARVAEPGAETQMVIARMEENQCTLRLDMSGELLHRRGWRQETARAPLRESMAAALLRFSGWKSGESLVDPMCGAGTWPIEAACHALRQAPGLGRSFAFMRWPCLDAGLWSSLETKAKAEALAAVPAPILAADRSDKALESAQRNAERAGVQDQIQWVCSDLEALELPAQPGLIVCNPPYGKRIGRGTDLAPLYQKLGALLARHPGWRLCCLTSREDLRDAVLCAGGVAKKEEIRFKHGGLRVMATLFVHTG